MKVRLLDKDMKVVDNIDLPREKAEGVASAGVVTYKGRYFTYGGFEGSFYEVARFIESDPPFALD